MATKKPRYKVYYQVQGHDRYGWDNKFFLKKDNVIKFLSTNEARKGLYAYVKTIRVRSDDKTWHGVAEDSKGSKYAKMKR